MSFVLRTNTEIRSPGYLLNALERQVPEMSYKVGEIRLTKDKKVSMCKISHLLHWKTIFIIHI